MSRLTRKAAARTIDSIERMTIPQTSEGGVDLASLIDDDGPRDAPHDVRREVAVDPVLEKPRPTTLAERLGRMPGPVAADLAPKSIEQKVSEWKARIERAMNDPRWRGLSYTVAVMYTAIVGFCRATLEGRQYGGPQDGASFDLRALLAKGKAPFGKSVEERLRSMLTAIREFRKQEDGRAFETNLKPEQRYAYGAIEKLCEDLLGEPERRSGRRIPLVKSIGLDLETFSTPAA